MTLRQLFCVAVTSVCVCLTAGHAVAQGWNPSEHASRKLNPSTNGEPTGPMMSPQSPSGQAAGTAVARQTVEATPRPADATAASSAPATARPDVPHSLLDEPASPARIQLSGDRLSIQASNASLSEVIHQVAAESGMQVEGDTRDERVFGSYGPGSPSDVLSALLYDSGYNMIMIGNTADGTPRRLVLSARAIASASPAATTSRNSDDDEEEPAQEAPPTSPMIQMAPPGVPSGPGQPKTPQQMLEELQRMHQGQQQPEQPHE